MLTFQFLDGKAVTFSFEARRDASDRFSPWEGMWRAYELYLSIGFERDMIFLRTNARKNQVHRYRTTTSRRRERQLFMLLARRADELARKPEWYHSFQPPAPQNCALKSTEFLRFESPTCGVCSCLATALGWRTAWASCNAGVRLKKRASAHASTWTRKRTGKAITAPCSMRPCPVMPSEPSNGSRRGRRRRDGCAPLHLRHVVHALGAGCQDDILQRPRHACEVNHLYLTVRMQANDHARLSRYGVHRLPEGILRRSLRSRASRHRSWPQSGCGSGQGVVEPTALKPDDVHGVVRVMARAPEEHPSPGQRLADRATQRNPRRRVPRPRCPSHRRIRVSSRPSPSACFQPPSQPRTIDGPFSNHGVRRPRVRRQQQARGCARSWFPHGTVHQEDSCVRVMPRGEWVLNVLGHQEAWPCNAFAPCRPSSCAS